MILFDQFFPFLQLVVCITRSVACITQPVVRITRSVVCRLLGQLCTLFQSGLLCVNYLVNCAHFLSRLSVLLGHLCACITLGQLCVCVCISWSVVHISHWVVSLLLGQLSALAFSVDQVCYLVSCEYHSVGCVHTPYSKMAANLLFFYMHVN